MIEWHDICERWICLIKLDIKISWVGLSWLLNTRYIQVSHCWSWLSCMLETLRNILKLSGDSDDDLLLVVE